MRVYMLRLIATAVLAAGLATAADAQTKAPAKKPAAKAAASKPASEPPPPPYVPGEPVKTSEQIKRESVQGAATAPLRDLNLSKTQIPEILLQSLADPYARPPRNWKCPALANLIRPLDDALGPDIDRIPPGDENLMDRGKGTALSVAGDLASGAIPFRGVVRRLSGAASHDALVQSSIVAGNVRRAYLKGLGEAKGCMPPATPSHERAGSIALEDKQRPPSFSPRYPTRTDPGAPQTTAGSPPSGQPKSRP